MKTLFFSLIGALAIAGGTAHMQEPAKTHDHSEQTMPAAPGAAMHGMPMMNMQAMAERDRKLDELIVQLNAAKGNDRVDKLVAIVNELAAERQQMHGMMMSMHGGMKQMTNDQKK